VLRNNGRCPPVVVSYISDECGAELDLKVPDSGEFMPLDSCVAPACARLPKKAKARVNVSVRGSRFEKFQELKIQETPEQVPVGHIPRSITVHCRGESTRQCSPGDVVEAVGIYLPRQLGAFEQMRMELMQSTFLLCMQIRRTKKNYSELARDALGADMDEEVDEIAEAPEGERYERLARSIAPEIYGMADVKKALLLQLVGGVTRKPGDGMSIRGDLNVLLMGDPGVAKSQLLKYISSVAPRGVYTTGKGSSGVGLTACVTRDKSTGEVALEGGALVLADLSICCIDEFDKMEETDRTAIHEVMEQQTVSIAKAGVTTTLNARTSILAAANPVLGRYNPRMSIAENINLPTALLSRFDLQFLLRDVADLDNDLALARHITHVHRFAKHPKLAFAPVRPAVLRAYIALARKVQPVVPERLEGSIVQAYVEMRREDLHDAEERGAMPQLTARQLLSVLRMAQALARLRFDEEVSERDVAEAIRLIKVSKEELSESERDAAAGPNRQNRQDDLVSRCFNVVVQAHKAQGGRALRYADVEQTVLAKGFTAEQLAATLDDYENLNVVQRSANGATIYFVGEP
jgi:DNA replication licensing factor MCM7